MHKCRISFKWIFLLCCVSLASSWVINTPDPNDHLANPSAVVVNILKSCYADAQTMVIHGDSMGSMRHISDLQPISMIILGNNSSLEDNVIRQRKKVDLFFMTANSTTQLYQTLVSFKKSPEWDIMAPFFIVDGSRAKCENAENILKATWSMNIVTAFFSCSDRDRQPMIYTYNPYTNRAPDPWEEVKTINTNPRDRWTLYKQSYQNGINCISMRFDRTKHLDGAVIKVFMRADHNATWIQDKYYDYENLPEILKHPRTKDYLKALKNALNVTVAVRFDSIKFSDITWATRINQYMQNGCDITFAFQNTLFVVNETTTYPTLFSGYCILTQHRGYYTTLQKIAKYYGMVTLISMVIILTMTYGVIVLSGKIRKWSFAGYEILRLLINAALETKMNTASSRIFFCMIFLYFLIIHATFQGHLASWLTIPENITNVEKLEDLHDPRYTAIYVIKPAENLIEDPLLKQKMVLTHNPFCGELVQKNASIACVSDCLAARQTALDYDLHIAKEVFGMSQYVFVTRDDWPLRDRVNTIMMTFIEINLVERVTSADYKQNVETKMRWDAMTRIDYRPIDLASLEFAFEFLTIGLIFTMICFATEFLSGKIISRKNKNVRRRRVFPSTIPMRPIHAAREQH